MDFCTSPTIICRSNILQGPGCVVKMYASLGDKIVEVSYTSTRCSTMSTLVDYFSSTPWCARLLQGPAIVPFLPVSREDPSQELPEGCPRSQDQFFKRVLYNDEAVPHILGFYQDPFLDPAGGHPDLPFVIRSISLLCDLRPGLSGFNGTVHGGFIGAAMDQAMGTLIYHNYVVNKDAKIKGLLPSSAADFTRVVHATASMDVRYRRPLPSPQIVIVTATLDRVEGRKTHLRVFVRGKEGEEYASCHGTWVALSRGKL
ncbi:HotDog domain-containing protein [Hypoxylon trugodes]|uniref:HotDog domain-containing protein n=1 Tax=Hypoxylon trugodes TaxID=326681 RepID=UPI0021A0824A|nr:HotDog domain-containing protein [Hypoxylon trugodes]KAI1384258.1 HotDog domain-containing protein [Hypoxylon trugodes]